MEEIADIEQIKAAFEFLVTRFGYVVADERVDPENFGNCLVHYQSKKMEISVVLDRGKLVIDFRPRRRVRKSTWFGIQSLYEFLAPSVEEPARKHLDDWRKSPLEDFFHTHFESVLRGDFANWKQVEKSRTENTRRGYEEFTGKKYPK